MAIIYLVRHGEADYNELTEKGFFGFGRDFAPLSENGIKQAEAMAVDERLKTAELIVSSPYTRALQTASIISRVTGLRIHVEADLHEWIPDKNNTYKSSEEAFRLTEEFNECNGIYPEGCTMKWETIEEIKTRMRRVADKYAKYDRVIFVGHSMAFKAFVNIDHMNPAEIVECEYNERQEVLCNK